MNTELWRGASEASRRFRVLRPPKLGRGFGSGHFSGRRIVDVLGFIAVCVMLWWIVFEAILAVRRML